MPCVARDGPGGKCGWLCLSRKSGLLHKIDNPRSRSFVEQQALGQVAIASGRPAQRQRSSPSLLITG